jgi:type II secretory pathway pseudopilin PulG
MSLDAATTPPARAPRRPPASPRARGQQGGFALVALLALMTIMVMLAMAAAPNIIQQAQRERELEAITRGEEVSEAIERFVRMGGRPPNSMEELLEGVNPQGRTKKVRVLRAYAVRDPLSSDGEWKLVQQQGRELSRFQQSLMDYLGGMPIPPSQEPWKQNARPRGISSGDLGRGGPEGGEDTSSNSSVPFIGVLSRSRRESIVTYFGIDRHDEWLFTPIYR